MTNQQLEKLLELYKKAVENNLTAGDFIEEVTAAKIQIDRSFVETGKEDENLGKFIEELYQLQNSAKNE